MNKYFFKVSIDISINTIKTQLRQNEENTDSMIERR